MSKPVTDVKMISGEEVDLQQQLPVCDMRIDLPPKSKRKFTPRLKVWTPKDPKTSNPLQEVLKSHVSASAGVADAATDDLEQHQDWPAQDNLGGVWHNSAPPLAS